MEGYSQIDSISHHQRCHIHSGFLWLEASLHNMSDLYFDYAGAQTESTSVMLIRLQLVVFKDAQPKAL